MCLEADYFVEKRYLLFVVLVAVSDSLRPHGPQPARLLCLWDSPGKNTGVRCNFLLQEIFPTQGLNQRFCGSWIGRQILYHRATWEDWMREFHWLGRSKLPCKKACEWATWQGTEGVTRNWQQQNGDVSSTASNNSILPAVMSSWKRGLSSKKDCSLTDINCSLVRLWAGDPAKWLTKTWR